MSTAAKFWVSALFVVTAALWLMVAHKYGWF